MKIRDIASKVDHSYLKAYATHEDMERLCAEAVKYGFAMVAINSCQVKRCREILGDSEVHVGAAIGFPLGQQTIETKAFETEDAIRNGADEIDYVINITELKARNYDYVEKEMRTIVDICRRENKIVKVIFENCYLTKDEIVKMSEIARKVKPDYVKTSSGFGTGGATLEDVRLMKSVVGDEVRIKAATGIRTYADAVAFIEAGAERLGTSSGMKIIAEGIEKGLFEDC